MAYLFHLCIINLPLAKRVVLLIWFNVWVNDDFGSSIYYISTFGYLFNALNARSRLKFIRRFSPFAAFAPVQDKHYDLGRRPATQEDIKFLLATIAEVQAISPDVELRTAQVREQYRMLSVHGVQVMC